MATRQTSLKSGKAIAGAILLSLGLLFLLANLDGVAARISNSYALPSDSLSAALEFGLAALRAAQAYLFDQPSFLSGLQQILVSFWPLALIIIGTLLLQDAFKGRFATYQVRARFADGRWYRHE